MSVLKRLKKLQHVSIIIQIIFIERNATHTRQTICCRITTNNLHNFKKLIKTFKFSDFNKEPTSSLKMI
jgi:hypothetical protein